MININKFRKFSKDIKGQLLFNYDIKKTNWFNIGGRAKVFFKPDSLVELVSFLRVFGHNEKIFVLGAGSNVLITDSTYDGVIIKLGKSFRNISLLSKDTLVAGSSTPDKKLSDFACEKNIGGFEFLSCIPGTIGGGLKINSGCFGREFKDILLSVQAVTKRGIVVTIPESKIRSNYRENDLDKDLIFLSATFKGKLKDKLKIKEEINILKSRKEITQPTKVKTGGSTFKNPIKQTDKKVWQLIKESVSLNTKFGDAQISKKHCNFLVNKKNATFDDMNNLVKFVKKCVKEKTGIQLETEIIIVE